MKSVRVKILTYFLRINTCFPVNGNIKISLILNKRTLHISFHKQRKRDPFYLQLFKKKSAILTKEVQIAE